MVWKYLLSIDARQDAAAAGACDLAEVFDEVDGDPSVLEAFDDGDTAVLHVAGALFEVQVCLVNLQKRSEWNLIVSINSLPFPKFFLEKSLMRWQPADGAHSSVV